MEAAIEEIMVGRMEAMFEARMEIVYNWIEQDKLIENLQHQSYLRILRHE